MIATQTINWKPFSEKHKRYIKNALKHRMCVAEGAVRSGKTIDHCIIASMYLDTCTDRIHLATGSTIANAKLNIGDCNGFGLEYLFRGRCRWGKYKENEALYIDSINGEKIVLFSGGGKADSYKRILGNSYGLWIATEINEHNDSEDSKTSFIKVAFDRQIASDKPFTLWDLNPSKPNAKIYTDYVDKYIGTLEGGYLYEHFTIHDNLSITEERKKQIISQYDTATVWYRRNILGQRCNAEGLAFQILADSPDKWDITADEIKDKTFWHLETGLDVGGAGSSYSFVTAGIDYDNTVYYILAEKIPPKGLTPNAVGKRLEDHIRRVHALTGRKPDYINSDHNHVLTNDLNEQGFTVGFAFKPPLSERPFLINRLLYTNKMYFVKDECKPLKDELCSVTFDPKSDKDELYDDPQNPIDMADGAIYSISSRWHNLTQTD